MQFCASHLENDAGNPQERSMFFSNINYYSRKRACVFIEIPALMNQLASLLYGRADVPVFLFQARSSV